MEGVVVVVFLEVVGHNQQFQIGREVGEQRASEGIGIAVVHRVTRKQVGAIAVTLVIFACHAECQGVPGDRSPDCTLQRQGIIVAVAGASIAFEGAGWAGGNDVDHPAGRSTAIGGSLRAAQHFDLLNVVEPAQLSRRSADDGAVLQEGHCAVSTKVDAGKTNAADEGAIDAELVPY